jgi:hypothetical protein
VEALVVPVVEDHEPESSEPLRELEESVVSVSEEEDAAVVCEAAVIEVSRVDGFAAATAWRKGAERVNKVKTNGVEIRELGRMVRCRINKVLYNRL